MTEQREPEVWRIAIVEDHLLQRERTAELIDSEPRFAVIHCSETMPEFLSWLRTTRDRSQRPHLLVLDLMVERQPAVDPKTVKTLLTAGLKIVVVSAMASPPLVRDIVRAGVAGIVGKRDSETDILEAVWTVLRGGEWMTPELAAVIAGDPNRPRLSIQEERALVLYASGLTLGAVAESIGVKRDTAKQYIDRVKAKYTAAGRPIGTKIDLNRIATADGYLDHA